MRNNQNLPNRRIDSNNVNGRQLPSTLPVYNSSRSRTPYRLQSGNNYNNTSNYQRNSDSNNKYNNRNTSYNRNNFNKSRTNSYNRNNNYNRYNNIDQAQDTQIAANQDANHRITEIIIIVIIIITDKDLITEIQIELIDTVKDQIAITDNFQTITIEMIEEMIEEQ